MASLLNNDWDSPSLPGTHGEGCGLVQVGEGLGAEDPGGRGILQEPGALFGEFLVGKRGKTMKNPQVTMVVRSKMVELGDSRFGGPLTKSEMASENGNLGELTIRN